MKQATCKLTIYLIKSDFTRFNEIIKDNVEAIDVESGSFYSTPSTPSLPSWLSDFFGSSLSELKLRVASARGLYLTSVKKGSKERIFAITFGSGRFLLKDGVIEERFGLRVTLNSVMPNSLRSIDKVSLGATAKQSREQISKAGGAASFGIDIEQDLMNAATGKSKIEKFGKVVSGKDSLALSAKFNVNNINELLITCLNQYESTDYTKDFPWIDQIKDVRDPKVISDLNSELLAKINSIDLEKIGSCRLKLLIGRT